LSWPIASPPTSNANRSVAITALAPALFGFTYLLARSDLLPHGRPLLVAALRVVPAAVALMLVARPRLAWRPASIAAAIGVFGIGGYLAAFFVAVDRLAPGVAATVSNTTPIFVLILSVPLLGQRVTVRHALAAAATVVGVALLVDASTRGVSATGLIAAVSSAGLFGAGLVCTRRWLSEARPLDVTAIQLSSGAIVLACLVALFDRGGVVVDGRLVAGTAILSLLLTTVPYALLIAGLPHLGPARVALLAPITPIVATVLGLLFLGESLTVLQSLGFVIVLAALVAAQRPGPANRDPC
jgi:probable blue pigment (indigoidine) exporter